MRNLYLITISLIFFSLNAQNHVLNNKDYLIDEYLYNGDVSNDGKWVFYESNFQSVPDSLVVLNTSNSVEYKIPKGRWGKFSKNSRWFTAFLKNYKLQIIDLKNDTILFFYNVRKYNYTSDENFLIVSKNLNRENYLLIKDLLTGLEYTISHVEEYIVHPLENKVTIIQKKDHSYSIKTFDIDKKKSKLIKTEDNIRYKNLNTTKDGVYITFFADDLNKNNKAIYMCSQEKCNWKLDFNSNNQLYDNYQIDSDYLDLSQNGQRVFFKIIPKEDTIKMQGLKNIQEWETTDKWIYPLRKHNDLIRQNSQVWYWQPFKDKVSSVSQINLPEFIKVNEDYVLKYNRLEYEPQYKYRGDVDLYLSNLDSGSNHLLLKKISLNEVFTSPKGNYVVYFNNENWWAFNIKTNKSVNLTEGLETSFLDKENDRDDLKKPYSTYIQWVMDSDVILVNDKYDIWKLSLDGEIKERLTKGREIQRFYRIYRDNLNPKNSEQYIVNPKLGFILKAYDEDMNSGYFYWRSQGLIEKIVFESARIDELKMSSDMKHFTFRAQSFDKPPHIYFYSLKNEENKIIVESNKRRRLIEWGKAELIKNSLDDGSLTKSVLFYPVNYDPSKEYPMIVSIYEKQSRKLHSFYPISWYSEEGFNPTHYTLDGYFVLFPDIKYEIGNPGKSALQEIKKSIISIQQKVKIDSKKIGLIGHSFGGYQTSFIITQSDMFVTAVAGAPITDLVNFYHTINWNLGQEEMWRFESGQMRMGASYYESKDNYLANSPFHYVESISTPLLLWVGQEDFHINYNESIRFFLALRRLNKKCKLILFENEKHTILDMKSKEYLSKNIKQWFDTFCK